MGSTDESDNERDFRSVVLQSWVETRMEKDRSLLTLASGGIGLLLTLSTTSGLEGQLQLAVYFAALGAFMTAVLSAIAIFGANSDYLEAVHARDEAKKGAAARRLRFLDRLLVGGFILGMLFAGTFTVLKSWQNFTGHNQETSRHERPAKD